MKTRVQELFSLVCDLPTENRYSAIEAACGDDRDLRAELNSLLSAHDEAGEFMSGPTEDHQLSRDSMSEAEIKARPGTTIGRYKLLQQIGEGGFGVVYMAQQMEPVKRRVAMKIIKLGMDTRQVIARFEAERQALAMMEHLNIASVLDAGATDTGRPYFVMELVRGDPITKYCNRERMPTRERLELFKQVCDAIKHAHLKGIIHRDIKPNNVLVTIADNRPVAKVIDFGIAKATNNELTDKTLFTEFRQLIGTPEYMSPEQADKSAMDIDTRSDIYSLGVLLYEILAGSTPFESNRLRSSSWPEVQRIIREEDPPIPSNRVSTSATQATGTTTASHEDWEPAKLASRLRGDLDWIVMKAMDKDRTRRYSTVCELSEDIDNYLTDQPVEASPPSVRYRMRKFTKRHRGPLLAAGLALAALLLGLATTTATMMWALEERSRAQQATIHAEDQAIRAKRFIAAVGTPFLSPDDVKSFHDAWSEEIETLRATTSEDDPELVRQESQLAVWTFFHSLADNLDMMKDSQAQVFASYPRAKRVLGVKDPMMVSLGTAYVNAKVLAELKGGVQLEEVWNFISADTLKELTPIYEDMQVSVDANVPASSPQASAVRLERAIVLLRTEEDAKAIELLNGYLVWRHHFDTSESPVMELQHGMSIKAIVSLLSEREEYAAMHELFRQFLPSELLETESAIAK